MLRHRRRKCRISGRKYTKGREEKRRREAGLITSHTLTERKGQDRKRQRERGGHKEKRSGANKNRLVIMFTSRGCDNNCEKEGDVAKGWRLPPLSP